jgi:serine/threonine protein kinase
MGMLQHPNVVSLDEVLQTDEHVFLVMELCGGGCLFDALPDDVRFSSVYTSTSCSFFRYLCVSLLYLPCGTPCFCRSAC